MKYDYKWLNTQTVSLCYDTKHTMGESRVLKQPLNNETQQVLLQSPRLAAAGSNHTLRYSVCDHHNNSEGFNSSIGSYTIFEQEETVQLEQTPSDISTANQVIDEWGTMWNEVKRFSRYTLPSEPDLNTCKPPKTLMPTESWIWKIHPPQIDPMKKWCTGRSYCDYMKSAYVPTDDVLVTTSKQTRQKLHSVAKCKAWLNAHQYWMMQHK